ncbi:hypothetical protein [Clostridium sp.]|uniref:hypothetical protein n=1 Tax=Clostridium sp. TaxID=1506 RepID=UPI00261C64E0|nr:hypothetical protein [uncultured Clostridium sp.]
MEDCKLSSSEKIITNHVANSNLCEYSMQTDSNELDYGAMRVLAELGQQVLSSNIIERESIITGATIYVERDKLKSWDLHFSDNKDILIDINSPLYIEWINSTT